MKSATLKRRVGLFAVLAVGAGLVGSLFLQRPGFRRAVTLEAAVSPGALSASHAFLANNCTACHSPVNGVEAANCIVCHADNQSLLQRQPTAFHADVLSCAGCHVEHGGVDRRPTQMDHAALARLGPRPIEAGGNGSAAERARRVAWIGQHDHALLPPGRASVSPDEAALNCMACHANEDRHRQMFGTDCIQCHTTATWAVPEFRHPSSSSMSCAQCHQAPPSHYMMHFQMVSMKASRQENAQVSECFKCHQTTSWNDIKGVGWYKHH